MKKLKVMTVVGTRPEIIRLARVMARLDQYCEHILVHTGQNYDYELNQVFFDDLGIRAPDHFLNAAGATGAETIGRVIIAVDTVLAEVQPDALLVLGDTNSCMAVLPAKRRKIPTFHMEAGNRCFDMRVPEEINRRIVDHTADINMPYSSIGRDYLLREGLPPDMVIKTGSPIHEVLTHYAPGIAASRVHQALGLQVGQYFVVSAHREENVDSPDHLRRLFDILNAVAETHGLPIIVSTHPRTRKRMEEAGLQAHALVQFCKPFGYFDYVRLQQDARCVLSDSGTITEESSLLNFPALNLREAHERPEGFEEASVMMVGLSVERVLQGLHILQDQPRGAQRLLHPVADYLVDNVSDKVLRIVQSYTDFVNRKVWRKPGA
ncbi:UDP-N-acetylglucosamine 2-epimerase (non-hydrolyzing) [Curvibacter sp. RS43]|uniref:non-hydrolyzing UDP-N-acetylglucosamine 2-epimerase n=1 Tax=Curvibacter microcysteis TaxID=3026419 RepID=UPI00235F6068|nr:UDP-N-acetylglucosamine 2-epimerase (non-hydrolyzing) [Curvibacter sp. RS43]MDD0808770.1 UDP-N-acetylglucosamine 2-epimerase (non-hydrolyzing) [Curvibacter sp. RS43]